VYEMMKEGIEAIPALVKELYAVVHKLEGHFQGRKFTLDGHLVGSIGEVLAAYHYNLELLPASSEAHDACCPAGKNVQVKATQGKAVGLRCEPQHLLVLKLGGDGNFSEVFNGPGHLAWNNAGPMQKNGQRPISVSRLKLLMDEVPEHQRLQPRAV
jgi:hypothetical protein